MVLARTRPVAEEMVQDMPMPGDCVVELRVADKPVILGLLITNTMLDIDFQRYSSLQKLLRVTERVLMFLNILKNKVKAKIAACSEPTAMSEVELLIQAKKLWVKIAPSLFAKNSNLQKEFGVFLSEDGV